MAGWFVPDGSIWRMVAIGLGLVAAGALCGQIETWRASTKMLGGEISTRLTGRVERIDHVEGGRVRLTIDVISTDRPRLRYAPDRVRVSARKQPEGVTAGSTVEGVVRLFPPAGPVRPLGYDFAFESFFDGRGATGFFLTDPKAVPGRTDSVLDGFGFVIERFRDRLATRIQATIGGAEGEIAAALIAGTRGGIPEKVNEDLRKTGLAHVLSISGLHMALVAATVMLALRSAFAAFPVFASRYAIKKVAAAAALTVAALYLLVSGAEVAALRSFIMLAVMLVAMLFDQAAITMRNLAISAILILVVAPHEIMGPSFQMSFAATAALIAAYGWWTDRKERQPVAAPAPSGVARRVARKALIFFAGLAATSLVAGIATTMFGAWHFQRVSPLSLGANLAAMPFVSVLVMPFAVVAMVAMPLGLDGPFLWVMGKGLSAMLAVAAWFAERSPIDAVGGMPASALVLPTVALVIAVAATTALRLAAIPFALAGLGLLATRDLPDAFVSEDARLIAVVTPAGTLAVNRARPNGFAVENWQRAAKADKIVKPVEDTGPPNTERFTCADGFCAIATPGGIVASASTAEAIRSACALGASFIVVDDATLKPDCPDRTAVAPEFLTARTLARRGAAEIRLTSGNPAYAGNPNSEGPAAAARAADAITYAITEPFRPWHGHRAFSRAARGMASWKPKPRVPAPPSAAKGEKVSSAGSGQPASPAP